MTDDATLKVLLDVAAILVFGTALLMGAAWWSARRRK
jgi:LPXTG-motif cell wall-anchored protein